MEHNSLVQQLEKEKIIVIVRGIETEKLPMLCDALYEGGIRFLELTFRPDGAVSDEEILKNISFLSKRFENRMAIGAGTVLTPDLVYKVADAGGKLIVSPNTEISVIEATKRLGLLSVPGALTPSEIMTAHNAGADFVKLFPANLFGPSYIRALQAPIPHVKLLAVGGMEKEDLPNYLKAGASGFGIGSSIADKKMVSENDYKGLCNNAKDFISIIQNQ